MSIPVFYALMALLTLFNLVVFVSFRVRQNNFFYGVILIAATVSNFGYLLLALSEDYGEALLAMKISYLAGAYLPSAVMLCVMEVCRMKCKWWQQCLIILTSTFTYILVFSAGYTNLFLHTPAIDRNEGFTIFSFQPGPLFFLFRLQIVAFLLLIVGICIYSFREKKSVSYKNMVYLLAVALISVLCYFVGRVLFPEINLVPFAYAVDGLILLKLQHRIAIYDVNSIVADSILNQESYGYIVLDRGKNYIGCDKAAIRFFPQLEPLHVDFNLPKDDPFFMQLLDLMRQLDDTQNTAVEYIASNGREYEIDVDYMKNAKGHHLGYYIEVTDATEERENQRRIMDYNEKLRSEVERETRHLRDVQDQMLLGMANMIENRDNSTGGHIKRTSMGVKILVKELMSSDDWGDQFTAKYCQAMIKAAPLHDVGKIAVDDDILKKPGRFTPGEFEQMKIHAAKGAELLHSVIEGIEDPYFVTIAENMAHYHHERWNGTGYPEKLAGEQIPMEARIMAIADVYDALVSKRCYKDPMTYEQAAKIITEGMGTQFDPSLLKVFEACRPRLERYYDAQMVFVEAAC